MYFTPLNINLYWLIAILRNLLELSIAEKFFLLLLAYQVFRHTSNATMHLVQCTYLNIVIGATCRCVYFTAIGVEVSGLVSNH
jgi:hypothetical protein